MGPSSTRSGGRSNMSTIKYSRKSWNKRMEDKGGDETDVKIRSENANEHTTSANRTTEDGDTNGHDTIIRGTSTKSARTSGNGRREITSANGAMGRQTYDRRGQGTGSHG